jgi:hypothetical protein
MQVGGDVCSHGRGQHAADSLAFKFQREFRKWMQCASDDFYLLRESYPRQCTHQFISKVQFTNFMFTIIHDFLNLAQTSI